MPSLLHEGVLELVRNEPRFATVLLGQLLDVEIPQFSDVRPLDTTLNQIMPAEFHADAIVMFASDTPVFGAIVEAQLQRDDDKPFSWPVYATATRARYRCPFVVVVVTYDEATARWAASRIDLGGGNTYRPLVIGPREIPPITDPDQASRQLHLAMLSVMAHGRGDIATASAIGAAASHAVSQLPQEQQEVYLMLIEAALSEGARKAVQMQSGLERLVAKMQAQNREEARAEGRAEGKAEAAADILLKLLAKRGIVLSDAQRQQILECRDLVTLERWCELAISAASAEEIFVP